MALSSITIEERVFMSVLVIQCPHCGAEKMTFKVMKSVGHLIPGQSSVMALCSGCDGPVLATLFAPPHMGDRLVEMPGNLLQERDFRAIGIWPKPQEPEVPQGVPDKVARSFIEAAKSRRAQLWNAACGSYRRCMELALKEFAPDVEAWKLEKRIDKLAAEHRITPALQTWAHELRLDGNEALHGDDDATEDMAEQMHHLTYFLLTYLYTLPNQIEEVRVRREAASE
ncbi:DUF4145 domain-containing protein [Comamonas terrae]|uniref:DUF4145 domain-containing protein n=3 Tax=Comamonas TaxID=283 RepID=A0ABW5UR59_9BURK